MSSLNHQATMDTYRTEALTNSVRKAMNSQEPMRNINVQKSYHSYRVPSQDVKKFSIRNSMTHEDDNTSQGSLQPRFPKHIPNGARSVSGIKLGNGRSVDHSLGSHRGMFALPSIRNNDALMLLNQYNSPNKYSLR